MKITLYTISDCLFSKQEKEYLKSHNLPFEEKNLETNKESLAEMLAVSNNFAGTPVTKIEKDDGQIAVLKGFTQSEFDQTLGLPSESEGLGGNVQTAASDMKAPPVPQPPPPSLTTPTPPASPPVIEPTVPPVAPTQPPIEEVHSQFNIPPVQPPSPPQPKPPQPTSPPIPQPGPINEPPILPPAPEPPPAAPQPPASNPPAPDPMKSVLENLQNKATPDPSGALPNIPNFTDK